MGVPLEVVPSGRAGFASIAGIASSWVLEIAHARHVCGATTNSRLTVSCSSDEVFNGFVEGLRPVIIVEDGRHQVSCEKRESCSYFLEELRKERAVPTDSAVAARVQIQPSHYARTEYGVIFGHDNVNAEGSGWRALPCYGGEQYRFISVYCEHVREVDGMDGAGVVGHEVAEVVADFTGYQTDRFSAVRQPSVGENVKGS